MLTHTGQFYEQLLAEVNHLSPAAFNNVLSLYMSLLPPIQHTMPPIQSTVVLTTQAPAIGILPAMGINFSEAGTGGGGPNGNDPDGEDNQPTGGDNANVSAEDNEGEDPDKDDDNNDNAPEVIIVSDQAPSLSMAPLPGDDRGRRAGSVLGGVATGSPDTGAPNKSTKLRLSHSAASEAAHLLIQSTQALLDCPKKPAVEVSDDEGTLELTASF